MKTTQEVVEWVRTTWNNGPSSPDRPSWTKHFNRSLARAAGAAGLCAWGAHLGKKNGQYMVDHCWTTKWTGLAEYRGMDLAAEFEWMGFEAAIEEDLVKLADVRAKLKIFVGNLRKKEWPNAERIAENAATMLRRHYWAGDDTIVLAIGPKSERMAKTVDIRVWVVSKSGAREMQAPQP